MERKPRTPRGPATKPAGIRKSNKNISLNDCFWEVVLAFGEETNEKWTPYVAIAVMEKYKRELYGTKKAGQNDLCDQLCDELL